MRLKTSCQKFNLYVIKPIKVLKKIVSDDILLWQANLKITIPNLGCNGSNLDHSPIGPRGLQCETNS